jgi:hypothetical protein
MHCGVLIILNPLASQLKFVVYEWLLILWIVLVFLIGSNGGPEHKPKSSWTLQVRNCYYVGQRFCSLVQCKVSKILNNKHCGLAMSKTLYQENLGHVHCIWNIYERPLPNLDTSNWHFEDYKVNIKDFQFAPTISIISTPQN